MHEIPCSCDLVLSSGHLLNCHFLVICCSIVFKKLELVIVSKIYQSRLYLVWTSLSGQFDQLEFLESSCPIVLWLIYVDILV